MASGSRKLHVTRNRARYKLANPDRTSDRMRQTIRLIALGVTDFAISRAMHSPVTGPQ